MAKIVLTGLNGYGANFIRELLLDEDNVLVAVVSGAPQKSTYYQQLSERDVKFYKNLEECLEKESADMVIICTPLHIHYKEVMTALKKGVHVYCEKPLTTTVAKAEEIKRTAEAKGLTVAVGFQWSYSAGIQALKKDLLDGIYGKLHKFKTMAIWKRPISYYSESAWKGRMKDDNGEIIFDSIISNPNAHYLHNMLFLAGQEMMSSMSFDEKTECQLDCYRAYDIETFDTVKLKVKAKDIELYFYGTLAAETAKPVEFTAVCEKGTIVYPYDEEGHIAGRKADGSMILYESPEKDKFRHYQAVALAITEGKPIACDVGTVEPFQKAIEYIRLNFRVKPFATEDIFINGNELYVKGLMEQIQKEYEANELNLE